MSNQLSQGYYYYYYYKLLLAYYYYYYYYHHYYSYHCKLLGFNKPQHMRWSNFLT